MKTGDRYGCASCATEVVVVRVEDVPEVLTCSGAALVPVGDPRADAGHGDVDGDVALLGKRYTDAAARVELLCTKGGTGVLLLGAEPLVVKGTKPLPSSD